MPQITVTLDEQTYMELCHYLPKGMKSAFVNTAVREAIMACSIPAANIRGLKPQVMGMAMHRMAKHGWDDAADFVYSEMLRLDERQKRLNEFTGVEEE